MGAQRDSNPAGGREGPRRRERLEPMSLLHFFFGFTGRITRQQFWLGLLALMLIGVAVVSLLDASLLDLDANELGKLRQPSLALTAWDLFTCWPNAAIAIKRLNDRGHAPWIGQLLAALFVVLIFANHFGFLSDVNNMPGGEKLGFVALTLFFIWILVDTGFLPGTAGPNRFGPDPLSRSLQDERQA